MSKRSFAKFWLPVVAWMTFIFCASTGMGAPRNTSRFLRPLLTFFYPALTDEAFKGIQFFIRKCAHAFEYAVLALLVWRAIRAGERGNWRWRTALAAIVFAGLYAATDEFHQTFVSDRFGTPWDVLLDTSGAMAAMIALWSVGKWRRKW